MSSIIEGYNYDIFISYRQKDNKGDRWVSEFVEALKIELESTFKEEISVYFDINPHNGLLETHDVDASLKEKLKCLIFIPIISRTYCDPKSFAWEHEFKAFVEQASKDQFGLKVKLANGNIASRVLPIRIHDLDIEDIKLYESIIGGVIRGIEFIYKEPGVNKPLTSVDDQKKNLNNTNYKIQINKTANAIKEIISGLKKGTYATEKEVTENYEPSSGIRKDDIIEQTAKGIINQKSKKWPVIMLSFFLVIIGSLGINKITRCNRQTHQLAKSEKTIAVLPFRNLSNDTTQLYFCDGFMEELLNNLQKVKSFTVRSRTSSDRFRDTEKSLETMGKELNVNYLVEGSIGREGNNLRIWIQLIDTKADKHLWSNNYTREMKDIFSIQSEIANEIAMELKTKLSPEEINKIKKRPTRNIEAYNLYLLGKFYINQNESEPLKQGIRCFKNAIQLDSTFALAYVGLSQCYQFMVRYSWMPRDEIYQEAKEAVIKAIKLDESLGEAHATLGLIMIVFNWDIYGPEEEFQKAIQLSPGCSEVYSSYAQYLRWIGRYDEGILIAKRAIELDPLTPITNMWLGAINFYAGHYDESIEDLHKVLEIDSAYDYAYGHLAFNYALKGLYPEAIRYADKTLSLIGNIKNNPLLASNIGWVYAKSGEITRAKEILTQVEELYAKTNGDPIHIAMIYAGLGEHEKAFKYLSNAYNDRSGQIIYLNAFANSFFKDISSDPRYNDLLKKVGFKAN